MTELQVIARYTIAAGNEDEVWTLVAKLVEAARSEPGNLGFIAYRELDDPRQGVLLERYVSREAFAAHRESAHFKEIVLGQIVPLLESRVVEQFDAAD